ncbi:hypothetical protein CFC21_084846 [Triticum aestivum]|uniref:Uncharacterized protein n=3 Tax=Triticum TaxID=4564 RepID=A0A9R1B3S0_TRITD|nr:uncharacterized protein LOC119318190 [Triticum dicoccoides]KAF7080842.1 hypothetical protein CFC21_084846 [Triticum aestivum]VAI50365.1 unnamed protein product [Triticum turgidum subsp. durum]
MGRKACIEQKNLPSWFTVTEYRRGTGTIYKTYFDTYNNQMYRSIEGVARAFGLGDKDEPAFPKPLNIRKEDGSCGSLPMRPYTKIPAIPEYVGKDTASDSLNLEQEELKKFPSKGKELKETGDVASTMKGEEENDNDEVGYAASNLENEEEMAKKINAPSADAASMQDEDVAGEVKNQDHA